MFSIEVYKNQNMFRKLVSNLPYSPALVGQLGFYAKRLRKEELTRRLGLIFTALALVVQSFAVFQPPEAANAASSSDFVKGGVSSMNDFLNHYDRNSRNIKDIFKSLGITRAEIKAAKKSSINSRDGNVRSWGLTSRFSHAQGERKHQYKQSNGQTGTAYNRPLKLWDSKPYTKKHGSTYVAWVGHSKKFGWFAIMKNCGNLITKKIPEKPKPIASCTSLLASKIDRTRFTLTAKSSVKNGATIGSYTFTVKDSAGKVVDTKKINTNERTVSYKYTAPSDGKYSASVIVGTSVGNKGGPQCATTFTVDEKPTPPPVTPPVTSATCESLSHQMIGRTNVSFTGSASVEAATISKYTIVIKDSSGKTVKTISVDSNETEQAFDSINLETPGDYTATLTVTTSLGEKSGDNCIEKFTIAKPDVCQYNPTLSPNDPRCQPCPDPSNPNIWIESPDCKAEIVESKTAINLSQGSKLAASTIARSSDRISYSVTVKNTGYAAIPVPLVEKLDDVLEYSTLVDNGGGEFNKEEQSLTWPTVELKPGEEQVRTFTVQLLSTIPATNTGTSDGTSYDCRMTNTFGNSIDIPVDCPPEKTIIEQPVRELPKTGPTENMIFAAVLITVVTYFYARSRQMGKEVRLIRKNIHAGTI